MSVTNGAYTPTHVLHPAPGNHTTGTLRNGSGAPADSLGNDGDLYTDEDTGDVYAKANGTWSAV